MAVCPGATPPAVRAIGKRIEAGFRDAAEAVRQAALEAGIPIAILTDDDQVAWLHPDGVVRSSPVAREGGAADAWS